ncbi:MULTISPECIES: hypothetical protein [unclassified Bradyrhizobium]|uniref:hypothetical protein n=1 Tax=unclassified Bradyrhizobium TaxID=2631580 RepID=UPI0028E94A33|nr:MULTISPECIES: hypothetical protein [unclassified Bradyrhizobium]
MSHPGTQSIERDVDLIEVGRFHLTVRDRADGREHTLTYDGLAIGANENGDGYTLIMPRVLAMMQGFCDA